MSNALEVMEHIYEDIREWLKFAETKNGALLTFNAAALFGLVTIITSKTEWLLSFKGGLTAALITLIISIFILLYSFLPSLWESKKIKDGIYSDNINLRFYKDIYKLDSETYIKELYKLYFNDGNPTISKSECHLAAQIIALSSISVRKYYTFTISLILTGVSVLVPSIDLVLYIF